MHKKLATFICQTFRVVIIPEFSTSQMVSRKHRKIGSKTARGMYTWAHYRFRQRLLHKAQAYSDRKVILCNEAYTSQTCGHCGGIHSKLGGAKTFRCPQCRHTLDRDANGARNIFLKYLNDCEIDLPHVGEAISQGLD